MGKVTEKIGVASVLVALVQGNRSSDCRGAGAARRSRASRFSFRRWVGSLVAVAVIAALAGCVDVSDTAAPTVSARFVSAVGTVVTLELTVSEPGTLYWVAYVDGSGPADVSALIADAGKAKNTPIATNSGSNGQAISAAGTVPVSITDLATNNSYDFYATIRNATGNASSISAKLDITTADTMPPAIVSNAQASGVVCSNSSIMLGWNNPDPTTDDLMSIGITWTTTGNLDRIVGTYVVSSPTEGAAATYAVTNLDAGETYRFSLITRDNANNASEAVTVDATTATASDIDFDDDTLIDICNLDMLNAVRHNLAGTYYATTAGAGSGPMCGSAGTTACTGYELIRNLDFANGGSYASNSVNSTWRPTGGDAATATNAGWVPIGLAFASTFEGNGNTISNLYVRSSGNAGLFDLLSGTVRNLGVIDGAVYGSGNIGIIAAGTGVGNNSITASYATTGTANGGSGNSDNVGVLVGNNSGIIAASYATGTANGGAGNLDAVGVLVGRNLSNGIITASYATGNAGGGSGEHNVGGLVGTNTGTITASYATGTANGGAGSDSVGGLVGISNAGTITASYATVDANGGADSDFSGALTAIIGGVTITASYGFGTATAETVGANSSTPTPASAAAIAGTNAGCSDGTNKAISACTGGTLNWITWATVANNAWNLGTSSQTPALKYADYDGAGTVYNCNQFPAKIPGTNTTLVCGTSLLPGQGR